jgi:hypothetical protein
VGQISYMGALGRELPNAVNINLNPNANTNNTAGLCSATVTAGCPNGVIQSVITVSDSSGAGPIPNGTVFIVPTYSKGASTTSNLLNPNFGAVNELFSNINSSYNAGMVEIENKSSKLIQYDVNYTWSHALDFNQNAATTTLSSGVFDPYNIDGYKRGANYGNSSFNVANRLVAWALINSPNTQKNNWVKWIANDWSLNPVYQAQNGLPFSATIGSGSQLEWSRDKLLDSGNRAQHLSDEADDGGRSSVGKAIHQGDWRQAIPSPVDGRVLQYR